MTVALFLTLAWRAAGVHNRQRFEFEEAKPIALSFFGAGRNTLHGFTVFKPIITSKIETLHRLKLKHLSIP